MLLGSSKWKCLDIALIYIHTYVAKLFKNVRHVYVSDFPKVTHFEGSYLTSSSNVAFNYVQDKWQIKRTCK